MVSPRVLVFYASTWKSVVKKDPPGENDITNFIKDLPTLRDYLSCAVCRKLLNGNGPLFSVELCDHYVCKDCKGSTRHENQFCGNCRDWEDFSEDETLAALLAGHSQYCRKFLRSSDCTALLEQKQQSEPFIDAFKILDILQEGAKLRDKKSSVVPKLKKGGNFNAKLPMPHSHVGVQQNPKESVQIDYTKATKLEHVTIISNNIVNSNSIFSSEGTSSSSNFVLSKRVKEKKLVQVTLDEDNEDDSIDIKIEPVYQKGDDEDDEMASDSGSSPRNENCVQEQEGESIINEVDDEEMPVEMEMDEAEAEELSGNVLLPSPQPTLSLPTTPTSISFSIPSSSGGAPQVIYARTTSFPQTVQKLTANVPSSSTTPLMQFSPRQFHSFVLTRPVATLSNPTPQSSNNPQQVFTTSGGGMGGVRLQSGQTIRLAKLALSDGRPVTMLRHVVNNNQQGGGIRHIIPISASDLVRKKIIVRPAPAGVRVPSFVKSTGSSSATTVASQLQRWPDANAVLQYASGSGTVSQSHGVHHTITVSQPSNQTSMPIPIVNASSITSTSHSPSNVVYTTNTQVHSQHPVNTKVFAGGTSMGNHNNSSVSRPSSSSSASSGSSPSPSTTATFTDSSGNVIGTTVSLPEALKKTIKIRIPTKNKISSKARSGCRCGNAASQPSKLTCCGQRCICYVDGKSCVDCKCRGCNNPYIPGGKKLMQGLNAVIDTKTNTTVPIMSSSSPSSSSSAGSSLATTLGGGSVSIEGNFNINSMNFGATSSSTNSNTILTNVHTGMGGSSSSGLNLVPMMASSTTNTGSMAPHIFTRIHHPGTHQPATTTFSQIIPVANFAGQFGQFTIPLPISLISPAHAGHTHLQSHQDTIHLQNIQINPNLNLQNHHQ